MIIDKLENAYMYNCFGKSVAAGLRFLATDPAKLRPGRYEIEGDDCYGLVSEYQTKPYDRGSWEAHRKYIDIHCVTDGTERLGYANIGDLTASGDYSEPGDCQVLEGDGDFVTLGNGTFAIVAPQDAHAPGVAAESPAKVRKIVVKVRVEGR